MAYEVGLSPIAERQLERLPLKIQTRLVARMLALESHPRPPGTKKLKGETNTYRIREGDYRIIFDIYDTKLWILVVKIAHRTKHTEGNCTQAQHES